MPHQLTRALAAKHHFFFAAIDLAAVLARLPALGPLWQQDAIVHVPNAARLAAPFRQLLPEVSLTLPHRTLGLRAALDYLVLEASRLLGRTA